MARTFSGSRLRNARIAAGLSPEQLAVNIGRSVYSIHSYEIGRVSPPVSVLSQIAHALGVDISDLFGEAVNVA
jgi:transcriptional regulator with XRE-family HTH domain